MKKKTLLAMSIAMCCAMNYSCTSDFEDEVVRPSAKRAVVQSWSPEVLQRARELGIIIVDEDRQWNNLTEDDVIFYLNRLTEKGDSAFTPVVTPQLKATGMLRRMSSNTVEETGSTVHDHTYFNTREYWENGIKAVVSVSVSWGVQDRKAVSPQGHYEVHFENTREWAVAGSSLNLSLTPKDANVDYSLDGTVTLEEKEPQNEEEPRKQTFWIHVRGTASVS